MKRTHANDEPDETLSKKQKIITFGDDEVQTLEAEKNNSAECKTDADNCQVSEEPIVPHQQNPNDSRCCGTQVYACNNTEYVTLITCETCKDKYCPVCISKMMKNKNDFYCDVCETNNCISCGWVECRDCNYPSKSRGKKIYHCRDCTTLTTCYICDNQGCYDDLPTCVECDAVQCDNCVDIGMTCWVPHCHGCEELICFDCSNNCMYCDIEARFCSDCYATLTERLCDSCLDLHSPCIKCKEYVYKLNKCEECGEVLCEDCVTCVCQRGVVRETKFVDVFIQCND
jgi:hypothetical protein